MGWKLDLKSKLLTDMIWEGWAVVYLFLEMLEFWRILSLKIFKISHDEFLYDESLNSYHSHIYMLARLWAMHLLFTAYEHWVWSSCVDPYELVMWLNQDSLARSLTYAASTSEVCIHIYPPISFSRTTQKYSTPNPGENGQKYFCFSLVK